MYVGYIRVSATDQCEARQRFAMYAHGLTDTEIFCDKQSGKDFNSRTSYQQMVRILSKNDLLVIKSIDRLGRNYEEIMQQWRKITRDIQADIMVLDMPLLDTRQCKDLLGTFIADVVLQVLSFVAQNERESIHSRQAEGIAAARERGVKFGRPHSHLPPQFHDIAALYHEHILSSAEAGKCLGMCANTFLKYYRQECTDDAYED